jgi:hypothetical protein
MDQWHGLVSAVPGGEKMPFFGIGRRKLPGNGWRELDGAQLGRWVGHSVPGNLYDHRAGIVLAAGAELGQQFQRLLIGRKLWAGPEWFEGPSLASPPPPTRHRSDLRRQPRQPEHRAIWVSLEIDWQGTRAMRPTPAALLDTSPDGMGIVVEGAVKPGTCVAIEPGQLNGRPRRGRVRACVPVALPLYRLSIQWEA